MLPLLLISIVTLVSSITIDTKLGSLKGAEFTAMDGSLVHAFKHVPFAQPPVAQLRYALPQPATSWSGIRDATAYGPACMSNSTNTKSPQKWVDEDCLHVNIFTSDRCLKSKKCAVMFYVHGGGFNLDSAVMFPDDILVENFGSGDVVLVITAFRLGFSGLLSFGNDNVVPRNLPLYDIILSLNWVQDNINSFGGDRKQVTLFGHSGGGTTVTSIVFSRNIDPHRKLFHQVISMSPAIVLPSNQIKHRSMTLEYIRRAGCSPYVNVGEPSDNFVREMVDCMRTKDAHELLAIQRQIEEEDKDAIMQGYIMAEPLFSSTTPLELIQNAPKMPLLTGATWYELNYMNRDYAVTNADFLGFRNPTAVAKKYRKDLREGNISFNSTVTETQSLFLYAHTTATAMTNAGAKCYMYSYRNWRHPNHTDDLSYIMGVHRFEPDENEAVLAKMYPKYFLNFVKTGVPDPDWEPFRPENDNYYSVDVNVKTGLMPKNEMHFERAVIDYWTKNMAAYDRNLTSLRSSVVPMIRSLEPNDNGPKILSYDNSIVIRFTYFTLVLVLGVVMGHVFASQPKKVQKGANEKTPLFLK